eukprot:6465258-Amphidinium_carterae.1
MPGCGRTSAAGTRQGASTSRNEGVAIGTALLKSSNQVSRAATIPSCAIWNPLERTVSLASVSQPSVLFD